MYVFVFARSGSKGVKKKNLRKAGGKSLVEHSITLSKMIEGVERIFVSTDDHEIKRISVANGVEVISRPAHLAGDTARELDAWKHAIEHVVNKYGEFDIFVSLPPTSPTRLLVDVEGAIKKFHANNDADLCVGIRTPDASPYFNMVKRKGEFLEPAIRLSQHIYRRQDAPEIYQITTTVYISRSKYILEVDNLYDGKVIGYPVKKENAIDIDDEWDLTFADLILKKRGGCE